MKTKIKILLLCSFALNVGCKKNITPQEKAELEVKKYLDSTLNDPKSYQSVKFDTLKKVYQPFDQSYEAMVFRMKKDSLNRLLNVLDSKISSATSKELNQMTLDNKRLSKEKAELYYLQLTRSLDFKGPLIGWSIKHEYRAKNGYGALIKTSSTFFLDNKITKIRSVKSE